MKNRRNIVRPAAEERRCRIRNRHHRDVPVHEVIERRQLRKIEAAMQGRHRRHVQQPQQWITEIIQMRMNHVEFVRAARHHFQLHEHRRKIIQYIRIEPQRTRPDRREFRFCQAVARSKQRHLVSESSTSASVR